MSRSLRWSFLLSAAAVAVSACGARTGDDELLGSDGTVGIGGADIAGGTSSGGAGGSTGGKPGVGGRPVTGGAGGVGATGGWISTGGVGATGGWISTGGVAGAGGWIGVGGFGAGGTGGIANDCCSTSGTPGCENPFVTACVCAQDAFCCDVAWDGWCADGVETYGCGICDPGTGGTGGIGTGGIGGTGGIISTGGAGGSGGSRGSCCGAHASAGCVDPKVEQCVCAFDDYCCTDHWDGLCVSEVTSQGCGTCGGGTGGIGGSGGFGGIGGTGGIATGGAGGATGGSGGMGTGGVGQCQVVFPDQCGSCLCGDCYSSLQGCFADPQCWAVLGCLDSPDVCQALIDLVGGWNAPSVVKALQLLSCAGNSGCPCN